MPKKVLYFLFFLSTLIIGTWAQSTFCCSNNNQKTINTTIENNSSINNEKVKEIILPVDSKTQEISPSSPIEKWEKIKSEINNNPVRLYFNTGKSEIDFSKSEVDGIQKIIEYINHVENSKILITGHSDNTTGPNNTNQFYSIKRAEFAKNYLVSLGVDSSKIIIESREDKEPIANNDNEEGRAKNRRAEILIK